MGEADDRYLAEIGQDCEQVLGQGVTLLGLERQDGPGGIQLTARYRLDDWVGESTAFGETVVAAHAALRAQLVVDRVRLGFTILLEQR
jgi:hypothetical protein